MSDALRTTAPVDGGEVPLDATTRAAIRRGDNLGRYIILDEIGRGGMGVVYAAYDPVLDRKVAVKVLHRSDAGVAEAQALARLSHPNVVVVHEAGAVAGQVFLAMEFVEGVTLGGWLEAERRDRREVVRAFIEAGRGLAAAHEAGLVHRDFKPDNVLVGKDGRIRVTDFGLAAAGGERPERAGTPRYMAPEQQAGEPADARSDQFSFCVALDEALQASGAVPAWLRAIAQRGLARDPAARHPSMQALLAALARDPDARRSRQLRLGLAALAGAGVAGAAVLLALGGSDPVEACRASARLGGTWDGDRREAVREAFLGTGRPHAQDAFTRAAAALDAYAGAWSAMRTETCEATRVRGQQSAELFDLRIACLDRRRGELASLVDLLAGRGDGGEPPIDRAVEMAAGLSPVSACADAAALRAPVSPPSDPHGRQALREIQTQVDLARLLFIAGRYRVGLDTAHQARDRARALGHAPTEAEALYWVGRLADGAGVNAEAETALREALPAAARGRADLVAAQARISLAFVLGLRAGKPADALAMRDEIENAVLRAGNPDTVRALWLRTLGNLFRENGKHAEARKALEESVELWRRSGDEIEMAATMNVLGLLLHALGEFEASRATYVTTVELQRRLLGPRHPDVGGTLNNLGNTLARLNRLDEALATHEEALGILESALGPEHRNVAVALSSIGYAHSQAGRLPQAIDILRRAIAIQEKVDGPHNPELGLKVNDLGIYLSDAGDLDGARREYERALEIFQIAYGQEHQRVGMMLGNLGELREKQGKLAEAEEYYLRGLAMYEKLLGADHARTAWPRMHLGRLAAERGDCAGAKTHSRRALELFEKSRGADNPILAGPLTSLGRCELAEGKLRAALPLLERALKLAEAAPGNLASLAGARLALAEALWATGGDRARALELARSAQTAYDKVKYAPGQERARAWLQARGTGAR